MPIRVSDNSRSTRAKRCAAVLRAAWRSVEKLESRTLLSSVSGTVYSDLNLSGSFASGDPGLAGIQVFDDLNGTGQYEAGDPSATTNANGSYVMYHVPLNTPQIICATPPTGWALSPGDESTTSVTLTSAAPHVSGVDFGLWQPITSVSAQDIELDEGQAFTGSVATVTDSAGGYANPYDYSGTLTLNGTSAVGFEMQGGNLIGQPANFPNLGVGTYDATVDVTESDNGHSFQDSAQFTVTINGVPISAQGVTTSAVVGTPWSGTIATFTDPDPDTQVSNYTATINYGDGDEASVGTISSDGSGGWLVTDTHTFTYDGTFTPTVTIQASDYSSDIATATSNVSVSLAPILLTVSNIEFTEGSAFSGSIGTLSDSAGAYATGNYSGTLSIDGSNYTDMSFSALGVGDYSVQCNDFPALEVGSYSATLSATSTGQTSSVSISIGFTVTVDDAPITNVTPVNISAYAGVPWTGTVATFDHVDVNPQASNYTATIQYDGFDTTPGTISSDGSGGWIVTATIPYNDPGNYSPVITISDSAGTSVTVGSSAAVTFAPLSLSASNLYIEQGQSYSGNIGLLIDAAGSYSNPANFTATMTWDGWIYNNLTLSSAGPGEWYLQASGMAPLAAGTYSDSLSVTETDSATGQSITTDPVSFSTNVVTPVLYAQGVTIPAMVGQPWTGTVASGTDNDPYDQPDIYDTASIDYEDGSAASDGQISFDAPNANFLVTDTHTFIVAGTLFPATTILDPNGNVIASTTSYASVSLAPISLATSDVWMTEGQSLAGIVGNLTDQAGPYSTGNYSGTLMLINNATGYDPTYSVSFNPDPSGVAGLYDAEIAGTGALSPGTYTAELDTWETCSNGQTVGASSNFAVNVAALPLSVQGVSINATMGESWTGTVATFTDPDPSANLANYTATISYGDGTANSVGTISSDGNGGWIVSDTHTFPGVGNFSPTVTINDAAIGGSSQAYDSATVAAASLFLEGGTVQTQEGQALSTPLAELIDAAGADASGSYYGAIAVNGSSYTVSFTPDGYNDGGFYVLGNNVPLLSTGVYPATLSVGESIGGMTVDAPPITVPIDVTDAPITAQGQNIALTAGVPWSGTVATFTQPDPNGQASDYTATISTPNGTASAATISSDGSGGWIVTASLTVSAPGNFSPTVTINDSVGGSTSITDSVAVNFASISLSASNLYLYQNQSYSGVIGTVIDAAGTYSNPANFSASLTWGDGSTDASLSLAADGPGQWDVIASGLPTLPGGSSSASLVVTESAGGQSISTNPANFSVDVMLAQGVTILNATVNSPWYGTIATVSDTDPSDQPSNYTATTDYEDGTGASTGSIAQGGDEDWVVTDTHTFTGAGTYSPTTTLVNAQSGVTAATASSFASVNLAVISLSTGVLWPTEGQSIDGTIGTLTDAAGPYATGNYSGAVTFSDNPSQSYPVTFVPDGNNDGGYSVQVSGTPQLSVGWHTATLAVSESSADLTQTVETTSNFSIYVAPAPLYLAGDSPGSISVTQGQAFTGTLLHFTSADPSAVASQYTASVVWGDGSTDSNVSIVSDPNGGFDVVGTHTFEDAILQGDFYGYYGSVVVQDAYGTQVSNQFAVQFNAAAMAPAGDTPATLSAVQGAAVDTTLLHFTIADPTVQLGLYTAYVSWGDFSSDYSYGSNVSITADPNGGFDVVGNHTYLTPGAYSANVTVQGPADSSLVGWVTVNISPAPLTMASDSPATLSLVEAQPFNETLLHFTDPNPYAQASDFSASVNWGDGFTESSGDGNVNIVADPNGGFDVTGYHIYNAAGNYAISVAVTDSGSSVVGSVTGAVADVPPTLVSDSPTSVTGVEGQSFTATLLHFTDVATGSGPGDFSAAVTWGDGTSDSQDGNVSIVADPSGTGFDVVGNHAYATAGNYSASITVTDSSGGTLVYSLAAAIGNAPLSQVSDSPTSITAVAGQSLTATLLHFTDADPNGGTGKYTAHIAWGDGVFDSNNSNAVVVADPNGGFDVVGTHTYSSAGTYSISVTVLESAGGQLSYSVTNTVAPAGPVNLAATAVSSSEIDLTWTNQAGPYDSIEIDRSTSPDGPFVAVTTLSAGTTSYADTGLSASTTYYYVVRTLAYGTYSPDSNTASDTTTS